MTTPHELKHAPGLLEKLMEVVRQRERHSYGFLLRDLSISH